MGSLAAPSVLQQTNAGKICGKAVDELQTKITECRRYEQQRSSRRPLFFFESDDGKTDLLALCRRYLSRSGRFTASWLLTVLPTTKVSAIAPSAWPHWP